MADTRACRACGEPMLFASTRNGKAMPVDALPQPGGNVRLHRHDGLLSAEVLGPLEQHGAEENGEPLHYPHHATCPHADRFRPGGTP